MNYNYNFPYFNQQMQSQPQCSGFVSVRSEAEARNYPVAYGNSVTFKDETAPYIYSKTMGYSQLDRPVFEKYKLVKEDTQDVRDGSQINEVENYSIKDLKAEIERIWSEIEGIKKGEIYNESDV